jgi:Cof subfamily protein (haloacid dehalogenase superfamily)
MYKLIISDLDETLLNNKHKICNENIKLINEATKKGIKFIPATGRGYNEVSDILVDLNLHDKEDEYVISFNGGAITENRNMKVINFENLPFETANKIYKFGLKKDVCMHVYTEKDIYMYNVNDDERKRYENRKTSFIEINEMSLDFLKNTPIAKVLYQNLDVSYLRNISDEMVHITNNSVSVSYSSNRYVEFNKIGVNKGDAVLNISKLLGAEPHEVIVVGDNYNDIPMLEVAGLSVAAGNAVQDVKNICDYICKNDNNEGVLAEVIEKFVLNSIKN